MSAVPVYDVVARLAGDSSGDGECKMTGGAALLSGTHADTPLAEGMLAASEADGLAYRNAVSNLARLSEPLERCDVLRLYALRERLHGSNAPASSEWESWEDPAGAAASAAVAEVAEMDAPQAMEAMCELMNRLDPDWRAEEEEDEEDGKADGESRGTSPPPPPPPPAIPSASDQHRARYWQAATIGQQMLRLAHGSREWLYRRRQKEVDVYTRKDKGLVYWKAVGKIIVPPRVVFALLQAVERRKEWDHLLKSVSVLEVVDESTRVLHAHYRRQRVMGRLRDFCFVETAGCSDDGAYFIVARSVWHPEAPVQRRVVRGQMQCVGWLLEPFMEGQRLGTQLTHVIEMDEKRRLRLGGQNSTARAMAISRIREVLRKRSAWPHVEGADLLDVVVARRVRPAQAALVALRAVAKEDASHARPAMDYSSADAARASSASAAAASSSSSDEEDGGDSSGRWLLHKTEQDVRVLLKEAADGTFIVRGEGIVAAPPAKIGVLLRSPERRPHWDPEVTDDVMLERVAGTAWVHRLQHKSVWPSCPVDMCLLSLFSTERDGSLSLASCSVKHDLAPPMDECDRVIVRYTGFLVEPMSGGSASRVVYVAALSRASASTAPSFLTRRRAAAQALCISALRSALREETLIRTLSFSDEPPPPPPKAEDDEAYGSDAGSDEDEAAAVVLPSVATPPSPWLRAAMPLWASASTPIGRLAVHVVAARGLPAAAGESRCDPFVELSIGLPQPAPAAGCGARRFARLPCGTLSSICSKVQPATRSPTWDEVFTLDVTRPLRCSSLLLTVVHRPLLQAADAVLAEARLPLARLRSGQPATLTLPMWPAGELQLHARLDMWPGAELAAYLHTPAALLFADDAAAGAAAAAAAAGGTAAAASQLHAADGKAATALQASQRKRKQEKKPSVVALSRHTRELHAMAVDVVRMLRALQDMLAWKRPLQSAKALALVVSLLILSAWPALFLLTVALLWANCSGQSQLPRRQARQAAVGEHSAASKRLLVELEELIGCLSEQGVAHLLGTQHALARTLPLLTALHRTLTWRDGMRAQLLLFALLSLSGLFALLQLSHALIACAVLLFLSQSTPVKAAIHTLKALHLYFNDMQRVADGFNGEHGDVAAAGGGAASSDAGVEESKADS
eukprot:PLAT2189.3.p1 GENE.PLAT2189.3~~PLAT2189.3.p1  ORF type:complete len:1162 (+),score=483.99 PLAT2189.3:61-3486(+)